MGVSRPLGRWGLAAVAVTALGGPLALAALYAPQMLGTAAPTAGFVALAAAVVFAFPLLVWYRYARREASSGGLYGYVRTAVGRPIALVQAGLWIVSYALYLMYTTEYVVYDVLTTVLPGIHAYRSVLEVVIPILIAGIILAGRRVAIAVIAVIAVGQLAVAAALAIVTIGHDTPGGSFVAGAPGSAIAAATGGIALLYVCGSLPLFFGGEAADATRNLPWALVVAYLVTTLVIVATIFPIAANPAFIHGEIPGVSIARVFSGRPLAVAVGVGVAVSIAGVMLVEYLALTRLLHAVTGRSIRMITGVVAALLVISGPLSLINPDGYYEALIRPSLVALWLSQLLAVAVFPWFARKFARLRVTDVIITVGAVAILSYGLYASIAHPAAS